VISSSDSPESVLKVLRGERVGTRFHPADQVLRGRKRWILSVSWSYMSVYSRTFAWRVADDSVCMLPCDVEWHILALRVMHVL
jgi:glutamate 5-kinase